MLAKLLEVGVFEIFVCCLLGGELAGAVLLPEGLKKPLERNQFVYIHTQPSVSSAQDVSIAVSAASWKEPSPRNNS